MRGILRILALILIITSAGRAQNLVFSTVTASNSPGDTISIPINTSGFINVSSFLIKLQYDPQVLKWEGAGELHNLISTARSADSGGVVELNWTGPAPVSITDGRLVNFKFTYLGGATQLRFLAADSIVMDSLGSPIPASFIDGGITEKRFTLTILKAGNGSGRIKVEKNIYTLPYSGEFAGNRRVTVEAMPDSQSIFTGFTGDIAISSNPLTVIMNSDKSITANFSVRNYTLIIASTGNGRIKIDDTLRVLPFTGIYTAGSHVKLEAIPDPENIFSGWSGSYTGTANPSVIEINNDMNITGNFTLLQYTLKVNSAGNGTGSVKINGTVHALPYSGIFNSGTAVTLEAAAGTGSVFSGWSGDETSQQNKITVSMTSGKTINATFTLIKYQLTINSSGNGSGSVKVNGVVKSLPYTAAYDFGSLVSLDAAAGEGSRFTGWGGDLSGPTTPVTILMDGNKSISAGFELIQYTLTINKGGSGQVKVNGTAVPLPFSAIYKAGTEVKLEALADNNSSFTGWSGDITGKTNPVNVTMEKNKTITALFDINIVSLNISKTGNGEGQIKIAGVIQALPYTNTFYAGSQVTIEAVPSADALFSNWGGDMQGSTNPLNVTLGTSKNVSVKFDLKTYMLTINKTGTGDGQIKLNGTQQTLPFSAVFTTGSVINLEASASGSSTFTQWEGDLTGSNNPASFTIRSAKTISVRFTVNSPDAVTSGYPANSAKYVPTDVTISWNKLSNVTGYQFQLASDSLFRTIVTDNQNLTNSNINLNGLHFKTKYFWRVRGKNAGGYGPYSSVFTFTTRIEKIGCPTNLSAVQKGTLVEVRWKDNSANESGFQVFRKNGTISSGNSYVNIGSADKDQIVFQDINVRAGEIYTYLVYAFNTDTISCYSNEFTIESITAVRETFRPTVFSLYQNFPNPFNPVTKIVFDLPESGTVMLTVFDLLGKEVAFLINNEYMDTGRHTVSFNAGSLSSGEYIYLIKWKGQIFTRKLLLIK